MTSYKQVQDALQSGASPEMLCMTCPWDRFCISPPSMTRAEVDAKIEEASARDKQHAAEKEAQGEKAGMPVQMLMTAIAIGAADTSAQICPVLAMRLRTSEGRDIVDLLKTRMQASPTP